MIMFPFKKYDSDAGRLKIDFHETPRTHRAKTFMDHFHSHIVFVSHAGKLPYNCTVCVMVFVIPV